jgi:hypothetical protein
MVEGMKLGDRVSIYGLPNCRGIILAIDVDEVAVKFDDCRIIKWVFRFDLIKESEKG